MATTGLAEQIQVMAFDTGVRDLQWWDRLAAVFNRSGYPYSAYMIWSKIGGYSWDPASLEMIAERRKFYLDL